MEDQKKKGVDQSFHVAATNYIPRRNGERAESSTFLCSICKDVVPAGAAVRGAFCFHRYCRDCLGPYIGEKLQDNISDVKCPGALCGAVLGPDFCRPFIPEEVFLRWTNEVEKAKLLRNMEVVRHSSADLGNLTDIMMKIPSLDSLTFLGLSFQKCAKNLQLEAAKNALSGSSRTQAPSSSPIAKCPEPKTSVVIPNLDNIYGSLFQKLSNGWTDAVHDLVNLEVESEPFNCPFSDCSASLLADEVDPVVECWKCRRQVCSHCEVPWHDWLDCDEFQRKNVEFESESKRTLIQGGPHG